MTLTRTRTKQGGFFVTSLGRRLTTNEMPRLPGIRPETLARRGCADDVPINEIKSGIGNAMTASVLERILPRVAWATGRLRELPADKWEDVGFIKRGGRFAATLHKAR